MKFFLFLLKHSGQWSQIKRLLASDNSRKLKETSKAVVEYGDKWQLTFSIRIKSEMVKVKENWRAPDSAQGSSGYSAQADCCHAEMQANWSQIFFKQNRARNLGKITRFLNIGNWLNFLNAVWTSTRQINHTEAEPILLIRHPWIVPCGSRLVDWLSVQVNGRELGQSVHPLPSSQLLGCHQLCILFLYRLKTLHILDIYMLLCLL